MQEGWLVGWLVQNGKTDTTDIPAASCGRSSYPLDGATKRMIMAVKHFLEDNSTKHVHKVSMVDRLDNVVKAFKSSLDDVCGSSSEQDSSSKTCI